MTISYNGVPQSIDQCLLIGPYANGAIGDVYILGVGSAATPNIGDVVSITWGTNLVTTEAPLNGSTVYVYDFLLGQVPVTPTLLGSPTSAIPMWQQAIGRASASAPCPDGYTGSWDTWPNNHTGGYVCNRFIPAYGN